MLSINFEITRVCTYGGTVRLLMGNGKEHNGVFLCILSISLNIFGVEGIVYLSNCFICGFRSLLNK